MDDKKGIKLVVDACKESIAISKDIQEQNNIIRKDMQYILEVIVRGDAEEMRYCNAYITNRYPDITQFAPCNCFLSVVSYNVVESMSLDQLQSSLLVAVGALNNMLECYKFVRIVIGGVKFVADQAVEGNFTKESR